MKAKLLLLLVAGVVAAPAFAQSDAQCILAGRVSEDQWAPDFEGLTLLGADGRAIVQASHAALAGVRQANITQPALLSRCDGDQPLANGDNEPAGRKTAVPALTRGVVDVEAVNFPKLRTGGELVELRVRVPLARVVMLTR
jgi:hypothetical protein